jgi:hypothetical protein
VVDALVEGILEAFLRHRALGADALRGLHAHSVTRKENGGGEVLALPDAHPIRIHDPSIEFGDAAVGPDDSTLVPSPSVAPLVSHFELFCSGKWAGIDGILTIFL